MENGKRAPGSRTLVHHPQHWLLSWIAGEVPPPFEADNAEGVALALALISGEVRPESPRPISKAVAVQMYTLFCEKRRPVSCRHCTFAEVLLALSVLHFGASSAGEPQKLLPRIALQNALTRKKTGLLASFRGSLHRRDDRSVSLEMARRELLLQWDKDLLILEAGGGGGGGDPGAGGSSTAAQEQAAPDMRYHGLDLRTRTLDAAISLLAVSQRLQLQADGETAELTIWHEQGGSLPQDALRIIDAYLRGTKSKRTRKEETFELQVVTLRQAVDDERSKTAAAQAKARSHEFAAIRSLRHLEAARAEFQARLKAADAAALEQQEALSAQLRQQRAAAAAKNRALLAQMQDERRAADARATELQGMITCLERAMNGMLSSSKAADKEKQAALDRAQAEIHKANEGRTWANVRREQELRREAEARLLQCQAELEDTIASQQDRSRKVRRFCPLPAAACATLTPLISLAAACGRERRAL